jgi:sirohydrochlorin cobaltochelatase
MTTALILFAHGARDPEWAAPLRRVQAAIRQQADGIPVELAFLEFMAPTLAECAATLVAVGATNILVVPMFIAQGGHLKRDVPEMLARLRSTHPEARFSLAGAIGENETVIRAMADATLKLAGSEFA